MLSFCCYRDFLKNLTIFLHFLNRFVSYVLLPMVLCCQNLQVHLKKRLLENGNKEKANELFSKFIHIESIFMFSFYLFHQRANLTIVNNTLERNESYHHVKTTLAKESKRSCDQNSPTWLKGTPLSCHINHLTPKNDQHLISPYNITVESHINVMRIKETITN